MEKKVTRRKKRKEKRSKMLANSKKETPEKGGCLRGS